MLSHWFWYAHISLVLALVLALSMVLGMVPAMADEPTKGSITINSPIMGAKYYGYKVFDLVMDKASEPSAYAYTIKADSPFYKAVASYAEAHSTEITLTEAIPATDPKTYNVTNAETLNAQEFGKHLRDRLADSYAGEDKISGATAKEPTYESGKNEVTDAKASAITFENLDFGYYLITNDYDVPANRVTVKLEIGTEGEEGYKFWMIDKDTTDPDIEKYADEYAKALYPDLTAAETYATTNRANFEKAWADMDATEKAAVLTSLQTTTKDNAIAQINEKRAAIAEDDNARPVTERFVFVDSTTPDAVINEKNEVHKWDVPVNPEGHADLPDIPDHDEPKGGKNIVVGQDANGKDIYAHSTETNIGADVHYQLSVNAVNYERATDGTVKQIKEYILCDYENKNMTWVESKGLKVRVVLKDKDGNITSTLYPTGDEDGDYTEWAKKGYFFSNTGKVDLATDGNVFNGTGGIVIPWVKEVTEEEAKTLSNVSKNTFEKTDAEGNTVYQEAAEGAEEGTYIEEDGKKYVKDEDGNKIPELQTQYFASIYPNDATILVDYWMKLEDTAVIDGDGNKNIAQYGVNYLETTDKEYKPAKPNTPPDQPKEPSEKKEQQDAVVYTYAIAIKKVDNDNKPLAGAKFKIRGVTAVAKSDGWYKVASYNKDAANFESATELVTDDNGILVVEGLPHKWAVEVQETEAPTGFNKLTETKWIKPVKTGSAMTTTSKVTYTDEEGNVTEISTTETVYKKGETVVAKMSKVGDQVTYSDANGILTADTTTDEDGNVIVTKTAKQKFDELVAKFTTVDETEVTKPASIAELEVVNNRGTELPATGGIGTTIFYIAGSILVLAAAILLITKRRMGAED